MAFVMRVLVGLLIAAVGILFVMRTRTIQDFLGPVPWAERKLGPGGTYLFYKLLGIAISVLGFIVAVNLLDALLGATIGRLFRRF